MGLRPIARRRAGKVNGIPSPGSRARRFKAKVGSFGIRHSVGPLCFD